MVEQTYSLDSVFGSLSDPTRRDILKRIMDSGMNVSEIARHYDLSLAAVAKHLDVLNRAGLVIKTRRGKQQVVSIDPLGLAAANEYLEAYKQLWDKRLDSLGEYLSSDN